MKFKISFTCFKYNSPCPPDNIKLGGERILAASDWADCVNKTKSMIDNGYKITGIVQAPEHMEVTPWVN